MRTFKICCTSDSLAWGVTYPPPASYCVLCRRGSRTAASARISKGIGSSQGSSQGSNISDAYKEHAAPAPHLPSQTKTRSPPQHDSLAGCGCCWWSISVPLIKEAEGLRRHVRGRHLDAGGDAEARTLHGKQPTLNTHRNQAQSGAQYARKRRLYSKHVARQHQRMHSKSTHACARACHANARHTPAAASAPPQTAQPARAAAASRCRVCRQKQQPARAAVLGSVLPSRPVPQHCSESVIAC